MTDLTEVNTPSSAVALTDKGEVKLDDHGRMIHEDFINFPITHKDLLFIDDTIKTVINKDLIPPDEIGPVLTLLDMFSEREKLVWEESHILLPVNYFTGMWHSLNSARKFSIYSQQWKKKDKHLDWITGKVAAALDNYHAVKSHIKNKDHMESKEYFKDITKNAPRLGMEVPSSEIS